VGHAAEDTCALPHTGRPRPPCPARSAFSLTELLVVMAIISVLAGMVMPGVARARQQALETATTNNLHQIHLTVHMYRTARGSLPPTLDELQSFLGEPAVFLDGWDRPIVYIHSDHYPGSELARIRPGTSPPAYYNRSTYQLFSLGRDGETGNMGNAPECMDDLWVNTVKHSVARFEQVWDHPGK
jgi:prepilin-type N-terminal cleavage/methylation domain-containing protein